MPDPVLRIPVDDSAFQRYMEAFNRYQEQLEAQPEMWQEANEGVRDGVAANLALADAIGASVSAAVRLGEQQERNAQRRKRDAEDEESEAKRAASWRSRAIDHVKELSRVTSTVVRTLGDIAGGHAGATGLFGVVSTVGKQIGGTLGGVINLAGEALNANYIANNAISDKGQFARGIGATVGQQEGFQTQLGRYVNTDQGIDAVMNARGTPNQWWQFNSLGVRDYRSNKSNADLYGEVLRAQVAIARRYTHNGYTDWFAADPRGASAFGTTHEDLNRLMHAPDLNKAIREAETFKSPVDKQIDASTKSAVATDKLAQILTDKTQVGLTSVNTAVDRLTEALTKLTGYAETIANVLSFQWGPKPTGGDKTVSQQAGPGGVHGLGRDESTGGILGALGFGGIHKDDGTSFKMGSNPTYQSVGRMLKALGWSENQARGILTNGVAESDLNPFAVGDNGAAYGMFQWHPDRQAAYRKLFHHGMKDVKDRNQAIREQTLFADWELKHNIDGDAHKAVGDQIKQMTDVSQIARAVSVGFEAAAGASGDKYTESYRRGRAAATAPAIVNLNVTTTAPPGHQTAVTANSAAQGG